MTALTAASKMRFVAKTGNDANDGLTWETAKLTIQAGVDTLSGDGTSPDNAGTVYVAAGIYEETVTIEWAHIRLQAAALGFAGDGKGAIIRAPANDADCIVVKGSTAGGNAEFVHIDGFGTESPFGGLWTGRGIFVTGYATRITNWTHRTLADPTDTLGGIGAHFLNCEACSLDSASISHANLAILIDHDFSTSSFRNIVTSACFRVMLEPATPGFASGGGHVFSKWKSVAGILNPTDFGLYSFFQEENPDGAQPGNNIYEAIDWSEDYGLETTFRWEGRRNQFIQCVIAPQATWEIAGFSSKIEGISVLGNLAVEGTGHFVNGLFADGNVTVEGTNHVFGPAHGYSGTLWFPALPTGNYRLALVPTADIYTPAHDPWHDDPDHTTPITAADLDHIEAGISTLYDDISP